MKMPGRFLSTVQIGITLIGILTGIYSGENITEDFKAKLIGTRFEPYAHTIAVTGVVIVITFFSLILGELVPKRIGLTYPEPIAKAMAVPMRIVSVVTAPFIWLLTLTTDTLLRIFNVKPKPGRGVTEEEIRAMVAEGKEGGEVQPIEQDIVGRVFTLGDRRVSSLMTHRTNMDVLQVGASVENVHESVLRTMHSVYPVIDGSMDNVVGVVTLKDLFNQLNEPGFDLHRIVHEPPYLPEDLSAYRALERFKRKKFRYGLVTDEHGMVQGIITMNDILEALVGDVSDLYTDEFTLLERDDGSWLVDGQYPLHDLFLRLGEPSLARHTDVNTIAGLVLHQTGNVPRAGAKLHWMMFEIEVVDMDGARIDKVIVRRKT
jgi:putative hemolysin